MSTAGAYVAGAEVCAVQVERELKDAPAARCVASNVDGAFSLAVPEREGLLVTATHPGYLTGTAFNGEALQFAPAEQRTDVAIVLRPGSPSLVGVVLDATGGPIIQARVQVAIIDNGIRPVLELRTDNEGRFEATLPKGRVVVRAEAEGYAPVVTFKTTPCFDVRLQLMPAATIRGRVLEYGTHTPLQGATILAFAGSSMPQVPAAISDEDGRFVLSSLEAGRYVLQATSDYHRGATQTAIVLGLGDAINDVELELMRAALVSGRVLIDDTQKPCTSGSLILGPPSAFSTPAVLGAKLEPGDSGAVSISAAIDRSGRVRARGVPPGRYHVRVNCTGQVFRSGPAVLDVHEKDVSALWRVTAGLNLVVLVQDESGRPIPRANVMLEFPAGVEGTRGLMGFDIDPNGRGKISGLFAGSYNIRPDPSYRTAPTAVELRDGDGRVEVAIKLQGSGSLVVSVRTATGEPVDDVEVRARVQPRQALTNAAPDVTAMASVVFGVGRGSGEFEIAPLLAGEYHVEVSDRMNPPLVARGGAGDTIVMRSGEQAHATVVFKRDAALSGRVVNDRGEEVANAWVSATFDREQESDANAPSFGEVLPRRVLSDAEGEFRLDGLQEHALYRVRVETEDGAASVVAGVQPGSGVLLRVDRAADLSGVVLFPDGQLAKNFFITAHHAGTHTTRSLQLQALDGRFRVERMPAGIILLNAFTPGFSAQLTTDVGPGQQLHGLQLLLEPQQGNVAQPPKN